MEICTFKSNHINGAFGFGGVILSVNNSLLNFSFSIFDQNNADAGGAIYQKNTETKLNQCSFFGNSNTAIGFVTEMSIINSIFQNNTGKSKGGGVAMEEKSVLNVTHTYFENNSQVTDKYVQTNFNTEVGGAIYLSKSVGNIVKSLFHNNSTTFSGGSVLALNSLLSISSTTFKNNVAGVFGRAISSHNSSMNIEYSMFENNIVLNKEMGQGGGLVSY